MPLLLLYNIIIYTLRYCLVYLNHTLNFKSLRNVDYLFYFIINLIAKYSQFSNNKDTVYTLRFFLLLFLIFKEKMQGYTGEYHIL